MKTVLITGGTRGIGRALTERFLKDGYRTLFVYNRSVEAAGELERKGATGIRCDLSDEEQLLELCNRLEKERTVDAFISNAGVSSFSLVTDLDAREWQRIRSVDLDAPVLLSSAVLKGMIARHWGRIVYISSMWGQVGASCEAAYSAAKAGLLGLGKALAKEVGPSGITVNCVCPGVIDTDMNAGLDRAAIAGLIDETPAGRLGAPEEVAALCAYLCSEDASFITGQVVGISGGLVIT